MPSPLRAPALAPTCCFALCLSVPAPARAMLDAVVITATRTEMRVSEVVAETTVLTRADLARFEARSYVQTGDAGMATRSSHRVSPQKPWRACPRAVLGARRAQ